jgi:hypothetical protein
MAVSATKPTIAATATVIFTSQAKVTGKSRALVILISNPTGGQTVYLGDSGVTVGAGFPLLTGTSIELTIQGGESVYGIVSATTQVVNVLVSGA